MKITIKKEYTSKEFEAMIKAAIKEFKKAYTEDDLVREFDRQTETETPHWNYEVIKCNIEAFPSGNYYGNTPEFCVDMVLEMYEKFVKLHFYCDLGLELDLRQHPKMWSCKEYTA